MQPPPTARPHAHHPPRPCLPTCPPAPQVLEYAATTYDAAFVLKTDDDAFINVAPLVAQLRAMCEHEDCQRERLYMGKMAQHSEVLLQPGHKWNNAAFHNHTGARQCQRGAAGAVRRWPGRAGEQLSDVGGLAMAAANGYRHTSCPVLTAPARPVAACRPEGVSQLHDGRRLCGGRRGGAGAC